MGETYIDIKLRAVDGTKHEEARLLVDTRAHIFMDLEQCAGKIGCEAG